VTVEAGALIVWPGKVTVEAARVIVDAVGTVDGGGEGAREVDVLGGELGGVLGGVFGGVLRGVLGEVLAGMLGGVLADMLGGDLLVVGVMIAGAVTLAGVGSASVLVLVLKL